MENQKQEGNNSRFAELALELFGAQAAQDFIKRIWESADDNTKLSLANAVVERLREKIARGHVSDYDTERAVSRRAQELAVLAFDERKEEFIARVRTEIQDRFEERITEAVSRMFNTASKLAIANVVEEMRKQTRSW